ncbi:MAG TPA: sigma-70 family RNA polymerase sigma factor [Thermoanaerobaculia bacterium]|nr:sigma-70 family RNA polymerase sigma factor [Thermoanaerobaculia bacterium]
MDLYAFDDDYVRRLIEGDRWTEEHFRRYFSELLLIKLRSRLSSMEEIEDLRQEVFVRVFRTLRSPDGIRDGRKLGSFVNSVCNNVLLESYRDKGRAEPLGVQHDNVPADIMSVEEALLDGEAAIQVRRVLDEMEPKDAQLLRAVFLEERDKNEICSEYGVDRDYLRVLLHRAKEKFRTRFLGRREVGRLDPLDTKTGKPSLHH